MVRIGGETGSALESAWFIVYWFRTKGSKAHPASCLEVPDLVVGSLLFVALSVSACFRQGF